jgi:hypothetical protein
MCKTFVSNSLLLSLDMTNAVFPTVQTQYILDFSSASCSGTLGFAEHRTAYDFGVVFAKVRYYFRGHCNCLKKKKHILFLDGAVIILRKTRLIFNYFSEGAAIVLKGQCHEIFDPRFFSIKPSPQNPCFTG